MSKMLRDYILYLGCYFMAAAYGLIYLLLKYTQTELLGNEIDFGYFLAISGVVTIFLVGFSGILAKKYGAHKVAALGALSCTLGFLGLYSISSVNWMYFFIAILIGFGWSFYYSASPMFSLSPVIKESEKGKYISLISVCVVAGTATLPVLYDIFSNYLLLEHVFKIAVLFLFVSIIAFLKLGKLFQGSIWIPRGLYQ
ncbi:MFS transporter [Zooshikella ganghwensis]|uniref:MFS transporter n=1 Tax=Zooshikella ganghwensis TaxID=202772 RepID=UPI0003F6BA63|nr:MFS transporter [Zooshikella ganghwensis]